MKNNNKKKRFDNELFGAYLVLLYSNLRKQIRKRKSEKKMERFRVHERKRKKRKIILPSMQAFVEIDGVFSCNQLLLSHFARFLHHLRESSGSLFSQTLASNPLLTKDATLTKLLRILNIYNSSHLIVWWGHH